MCNSRNEKQLIRPCRRSLALSLCSAHGHAAENNTIGTFRAAFVEELSNPSTLQLLRNRRHAWRAWPGPIEETFLNPLLWRHGAGYHRGSPAAYFCEQDPPGSGRHGPRGVHRVGRVYLLRSSLRCTLSGMSRRQKWRFSACGGRVYRGTSTCVQW